MFKNKFIWITSICLLLLIGALTVYFYYIPSISEIRAIQKKGILKMVTAYNPTGYFLYRDEKMGFEYEFLKKFAEKLGVKLEVIVVSHPNEMRQKLLTGEADIMAYNIPIMNSPMKFIEFSHPYVQTELVLIQRKINKKSPDYVGSVQQLSGKTISLTEQSPYAQTISDLRFDLNNNLKINTIGESRTPEDLIRMVADGEIEYTIANKEIALINKGYYSNLDIGTTLTPPQDIAFSVHRKHKRLLRMLNKFIDNSREDQVLYGLYDKYFQTSRLIAGEIPNDSISFSTLSTEALSQYDGIIQKYAEDIHWDWRLIASMIWQESKFKSNARSWAGALGLMQLMPATARRFGLQSTQEMYHPDLNIRTGTKYIAWLEKFWSDIEDEMERKKFIMASYNAGEGHVKDAQRLSKKYGYNDKVWDGNVEYFLLNKSKPAFYMDPVCKYGYCRGYEPFQYVRSIIKRYAFYASKFSEAHTAPYNFSLDFSPVYDMGFDQQNQTPKIVKHQLFEKNEVFQGRTILQEDTVQSINNLKPKNPERINRRQNAPGSNQLFRKKELFKGR